MHNYPDLFQPMQVGALLFRNGILSGPNMMCALDANGAIFEGYHAAMEL